MTLHATSAYTVVFATSLFRGPAKDWWVHLHDEYVYTPDDNNNNNEDNNEGLPFNGGPHYRFPDWDEFCHLVWEQFRDPRHQTRP